jgi:hypothetical protein
MRSLTVSVILITAFFCSCKKDDTTKQIMGNWVWTIQYAGNPTYNTTPFNTGISEILSFNSDGSFKLTQNGLMVNSGKYRTGTARSSNGNTVSAVLYTDPTTIDSVAYFFLANNNDSLIFSYDLIGSVGSGARDYGRQ